MLINDCMYTHIYTYSYLYFVCMYREDSFTTNERVSLATIGLYFSSKTSMLFDKMTKKDMAS